jgi:hypothetical protein
VSDPDLVEIDERAGWPRRVAVVFACLLALAGAVYLWYGREQPAVEPQYSLAVAAPRLALPPTPNLLTIPSPSPDFLPRRASAEPEPARAEVQPAIPPDLLFQPRSPAFWLTPPVSVSFALPQLTVPELPRIAIPEVVAPIDGLARPVESVTGAVENQAPLVRLLNPEAPLGALPPLPAIPNLPLLRR